ncbi:unnamed protein product [Vitrella brassicaformis CCMP3155]|uniref:TLDc domain-containing protein n=2 Tax=Vitrella brassicaformis TaxID=1169539 RepID=A0A0G4GM52_VITBC|nr:unnamed protein product [Vitrella brassicaformis CCMP3155]|eukprot:CEM31260.1 unnamed protein product [Vitrella brassicaformis CCMP3155]
MSRFVVTPVLIAICLSASSTALAFIAPSQHSHYAPLLQRLAARRPHEKTCGLLTRRLAAGGDSLSEETISLLTEQNKQLLSQLEEANRVSNKHRAQRDEWKKKWEHSQRARGAFVDSLGLSDGQYGALCGWVNATELKLLYSGSLDGWQYKDVLRCVGDEAKPLLFIVGVGEYVFGAYINESLKLPDGFSDDGRSWDNPRVWSYDLQRGYHFRCDVWYFSLAGHFDEPTRMDSPHLRESMMTMAADALPPWEWEPEDDGYKCRKCGTFTERSNEREMLTIKDLCLGDERDMSHCQFTCNPRDWPDGWPAGYRGVNDSYGRVYLGGNWYFRADELEVLTVSNRQLLD